MEELLCLLVALQITDRHGVSTPEGWQPGDDVILPCPLTADQVFQSQADGSDWYFRKGPLPADKGRKRR